MNFKLKLGRYLRVNLLGPGSGLIKKRIYRTEVSQRLRNTDLEDITNLLYEDLHSFHHTGRNDS